MRYLLTSLLFSLCLPAWAEDTIDLVKVVKSDRVLQLFSNGKVVGQFKVVLGRNPIGHKQTEGDGKTPEGTYFLDYKKSDSAYYKAIHISYPNEKDRHAAASRSVSPGGQIMIHGQRNGLGWLSFISQKFDWTQGCIALTNDEMEQVWKLVKEGTKIEILP